MYGLNPCEDMSSCGLEVTFFDEGYGWYAGGLAFYSDEGLESQIFFNPDFDGDGYYDYDEFSSRTAMVNVWEGEVDFVVSAPVAYLTSAGTKSDPDGDLVVEGRGGTIPGECPERGGLRSSHFGNHGYGGRIPLVVRPNPAASSFHIQGMGAQDLWDAQIHAMDGKCVATSRRGDGPVSVEL